MRSDLPSGDGKPTLYAWVGDWLMLGLCGLVLGVAFAWAFAWAFVWAFVRGRSMPGG
ncbi:MAG: hypothetical protein ABIP94_09765 [Planctomycetota bacterium]